MALRRLSDFAVQNARPKAKGYEISDGGQRGLRLAVHPSGVKSWVVRYRHPVTGISRKMTLTPGLGLAEARKFAADAMYQVAKGIDPVGAKKAEKQAKFDAAEGTLSALAKNYLALAASKLRSHALYKRVLEKQILPRLGEKQVHELRKSDVTAVMDRIERDSGPRAADQAGAVVRAMLNWHEKRSDTFRSPLARMALRVDLAERTRQRRLDDEEVKRFWAAASDERIELYGSVLKLLLLTGARRSECAGLSRSEIRTERCKNEKGQWVEIVVWKLPASRSKNKDEIVRPLSQAALDIINDQPIIDDSDFVFTHDGRKPIPMNHQDQKDLLDEIGNVQEWVVHDLRRTFRALLSRCRISLEIKELMLGHAQKQIVKTYDDILEHLPAMHDAAEQVAAEIMWVVSGEAKGKVIRLR
jgi:integrase